MTVPTNQHRQPSKSNPSSETTETAVVPINDAAEDVAITELDSRESLKKWTLAVIMLLSAIATTTTSSQLTNLAFQDANFKAPYLFVFVKSLFRSIAFPLYILTNTVIKIARGRKLDLGRTCRRCAAVCGDEGVTVRVIFYKFFPAMMFNLLLQIAYTLALANLSTSLATALTPPAVAFSYICSWLFLGHKLLTVKVFFVFVAFGGVGLIAYHEFSVPYTTGTLIGIIAMMVQDLGLSFYQLCFKKAFPKGDLGQVSFAISGMYCLMCILYFPVPIILYVTGVEVYDISKMPYEILLGAWSCTAVTSLVYGYGIVLAGGFFIGLSDLAILALNSVLDVTVRGITISDFQIIGTVIVGVAFIMLIIPDPYLSINYKRIFGEDENGAIEKNTQATSETNGHLKSDEETNSREMTLVSDKDSTNKSDVQLAKQSDSSTQNMINTTGENGKITAL